MPQFARLLVSAAFVCTLGATLGGCQSNGTLTTSGSIAAQTTLVR